MRFNLNHFVRKVVIMATIPFALRAAAQELRGADSSPPGGDMSWAGALVRPERESKSAEAKFRDQYIKAQKERKAIAPFYDESKREFTRTLEDSWNPDKPSDFDKRTPGVKQGKARLGLSPEEADRRNVQIIINLTTQRLTMIAPGKTLMNIKIATSSNKKDFYKWLQGPKGDPKSAAPTALGCYEPSKAEKDHRSTQHGGYDMGHSTFFFDGEAIHEFKSRAPSHGCVHTPPAVATEIYKTIKENKGTTNAAVCLIR